MSIVEKKANVKRAELEVINACNAVVICVLNDKYKDSDLANYIEGGQSCYECGTTMYQWVTPAPIAHPSLALGCLCYTCYEGILIDYEVGEEIINFLHQYHNNDEL
jgi:hypothetical protein